MKHSNNIRIPHGISLIELLVSMGVGIILLNAIIQVYASNHRATQTISGFSTLQENSRVSISQITRSLRLAGHYGGVEPNQIEVLSGLSITGVGDCNHDWITDISQSIVGYEGATNAGAISDLPSNCIPSGHYVEDSDVLAIRYASPSGAAPVSGLNSTKVYMRTSIGGGIQGGELLLGADIGSTNLGGGADNVGVYNYAYKTELFFLRPCSELNGSACDDGIPTLVKYTLDGSTFTLEAIAEGVEQFQIEYGVDLVDFSEGSSQPGNDYVADSYVLASDVDDWREVVSARFSLVIRSEHKDSSTQDLSTYDLAGEFEYTPTSDLQQYSRKAFTKVVQLRNMTRG